MGLRYRPCKAQVDVNARVKIFSHMLISSTFSWVLFATCFLLDNEWSDTTLIFFQQQVRSNTKHADQCLASVRLTLLNFWLYCYCCRANMMNWRQSILREGLHLKLNTRSFMNHSTHRWSQIIIVYCIIWRAKLVVCNTIFFMKTTLIFGCLSHCKWDLPTYLTHNSQ
jgi:hypothetical protein